MHSNELFAKVYPIFSHLNSICSSLWYSRFSQMTYFSLFHLNILLNDVSTWLYNLTFFFFVAQLFSLPPSLLIPCVLLSPLPTREKASTYFCGWVSPPLMAKYRLLDFFWMTGLLLIMMRDDSEETRALLWWGSLSWLFPAWHPQSPGAHFVPQSPHWARIPLFAPWAPLPYTLTNPQRTTLVFSLQGNRST